MKHLKHHAMHIAMCAPMIVVAGILLARGSGFGILLPLGACMLMMAMMMRAMGQGGDEGRRPDSR
jgi:hypothetical protein